MYHKPKKLQIRNSFILKCVAGSFELPHTLTGCIALVGGVLGIRNLNSSFIELKCV